MKTFLGATPDRLTIALIVGAVILICVILYMYPAAWLDVFTPEAFKYRTKSSYTSGAQIASSNGIVICGLVRDAEDSIPRIIRQVEDLGRLFREYRVFILENDSEDRTREKLLEWAKHNENVTVLGCGVNQEMCRLDLAKTERQKIYPSRMKKMAMLREELREAVQSLHDQNADFERIVGRPRFPFTAMWDFDLEGVLYHDGIMSSLLALENTSYTGICANGIRPLLGGHLYYDTLAHRESTEPLDIRMKAAHDLRIGLGGFSESDGIVPVSSCFGGFALYNTKAFVDATYLSLRSDPLECEHTTLSRSDSIKTAVNAKMRHLVLHNP